VLKAAAGRSQAQRFEALYPLWQYLYASSIRVAVPFLSASCTCAVPYHEDLYTLSPYLSGTRGAGGPRPESYILIGRALGCLHAALAVYPDTLPSWQTDLVSEVLEHDVARILAYSQGAERSRLAAVIAAIEPDIRATCTNLPAQYLHGDNVAILDLDHLHRGPRIYDLAYFLTDQVKWNTESTRLTTAWLTYFPHVLMGYKQVTPLSQREKDAICPMMLAVHLFFTDYLIQHQNDKLADLHLAAFFWLYEHQEAIAPRIRQS
jgi:Ser/Thr protein kinase RdoA (MazF antagonist)